MNISRRKSAKKFEMGKTMVAYEYPVIDNKIHGAVVKIDGRYPEKGRVMNERVYEISTDGHDIW